MLTRVVGLDLVLAVLWLSLFVFGLVELLRAILNSNPLSRLKLGERKPFSCNVCIVLWIHVALMLTSRHSPLESNAFVAIPSFGLSLILLRRFGKRSASPLPE